MVLRPIPNKHQAMQISPRNRHDAAQAGRDRAFAVNVHPPRDDRAVAFQRQTVERSRRNCHDTSQVAWCDRVLVKIVVSPRDDRAVAFQRQTVISSRRNRHHTAQAAWDRALPMLLCG